MSYPQDAAVHVDSQHPTNNNTTNDTGTPTEQVEHLTRTANRTRFLSDTDNAPRHCAHCRQAEFVALLLDNTFRDDDTGCLFWKPGEYPRVKVPWWPNKTCNVTRLVMADAYGVLIEELPTKVYARHRCDRPRCVDPDHLIAGSPSMNVYDSLKRGRWRPDKITPDDVLEIRARRAAGEPVRDVAEGDRTGIRDPTRDRRRAIPTEHSGRLAPSRTRRCCR